MNLQDLPPEVVPHVFGWKLRYGELILVPYDDPELFIFRSITLDEYGRTKMALTFEDDQLLDDIAGQVLQACLLWPEDFDLDDLSQADFKRLYERVASASPFGSLKSFDAMLGRYRERHADLATMIEAFLSAAFPGISPETIAGYTSHQVGKAIVTAEHILQREFTVPGTGKRKAPAQLSPDEVKAARAAHALNRREAAIARAKERKRQRYETLSERASGGAPPPPQSSVPAPAATPPPSMAGLQPGDRLEGVDRVGNDVPLRRHTSSDILSEDPPMLDRDFKREKTQIEKIWQPPVEPGTEGEIILGG